MPQKILIVEDDKFLRKLVVEKFKQENFEVIEAADGEQGLKKIKEEKPNIVLLDLTLPKKDGFQVLSEIKGDKDISSIPVIIFSNLGQREEMEKASKLGAADYLIKAHFTPNEIVEKVKANIR